MDVCSMGSLGHSPLFCAASPCYPSLSNQGLKIECNIKIKEAFSHRMLYFTVFKVLFVEMYVAVIFVTSCLYSWFENSTFCDITRMVIFVLLSSIHETHFKTLNEYCITYHKAIAQQMLRVRVLLFFSRIESERNVLSDSSVAQVCFRNCFLRLKANVVGNLTLKESCCQRLLRQSVYTFMFDVSKFV